MKIGGADPEFVRRPLLFEHLVPFGVFDFEQHRLFADRQQIRFAQREIADMNDLAGLVKRLIGGQEHFIDLFDLHRLPDHVCGFGGFHRDRQLLVAGDLWRQPKSGVQRPGRVSLPL